MDEYESFVEPVQVSIRRKAPVRPKDMDLPDSAHTTLWFDQGGTTGWAIVSVWPEAIHLDNYSILRNIAGWSAGEFIGSEGAQTDQMVNLVLAWDGDLASVGLEDFILRKMLPGRELLSPVRIGARFEDRLYTMKMDALLVPPQLPALAMETIPDNRLKLWGFWPPLVGLPHARDALKHGLTHLKRLKKKNQDEARKAARKAR